MQHIRSCAATPIGGVVLVVAVHAHGAARQQWQRQRCEPYPRDSKAVVLAKHAVISLLAQKKKRLSERTATG
jgi:hypothetical protein